MSVQRRSVRLQGIPVGILSQKNDGRMQFTYDTQATTPISLAMPLREQPYDHKACVAFFTGLLPESEQILRIIARHYGISPHNTFALLSAIGHDCAGAISVHMSDEPIQTHRSVTLSGRIISELSLYQHIQALPREPLFMGIDDLKLSLAGVQDKAAIAMLNHAFIIPDSGCPTSHILKPAISHSDIGGTVENEYFCLNVASRMGIHTAKADIIYVKDTVCLLIERYDRHIKDGMISRIHQEDFCQALGLPSSQKYQQDGGPSIADCFKLLNHCENPALARQQFISVILFNFLLGNMDAHSKNFSLLHHQGLIILAPFYDILSTRIYPKLSNKMAMKIGGEYHHDHIFIRHWQRLCDEIDLSFTAFKKMLSQQHEKLLMAMNAEREIMQQKDIDTKTVDKIIKFVTDEISRQL